MMDRTIRDRIGQSLRDVYRLPDGTTEPPLADLLVRLASVLGDGHEACPAERIVVPLCGRPLDRDWPGAGGRWL